MEMHRFLSADDERGQANGRGGQCGEFATFEMSWISRRLVPAL